MKSLVSRLDENFIAPNYKSIDEGRVDFNKISKKELKSEIEKLAKEENITYLEACSAMQGAAAKMGSEKIISTIHELKMETPEMKHLTK